MAVKDSVICSDYAIYHGDCVEVMRSLPSQSVGFSVHSPPFANNAGGLYRYSSDPRDMSNNDNFERFMEQYGFAVAELARLTKPGRLAAVHCMDVPTSNSGCDHLLDFPGEIVRLYERHGFRYAARFAIWKEPLAVRNRTMAKNLAHKTIVDDSSHAGNAGADFLLVFRRAGVNAEPIAHPTGLDEYAGATPIPADLHAFRGWKGKQTENRFSHWIWRRYASSIWDDIRLDRVLPFREARDSEDEKHVHPLQLDVVCRAVTLWSNPGDVVLTPFMGVGSEVYEAVRMGRRGVGIELKDSYYRQAVRNVEAAKTGRLSLDEHREGLFDSLNETSDDPPDILAPTASVACEASADALPMVDTSSPVAAPGDAFAAAMTAVFGGAPETTPKRTRKPRAKRATEAT